MPSKKIFIPLILALLLGGGWLFSANKKEQLPAENKIAARVNDNTWETHSLDSDNDGLKDWEELLWKTDPKNSDTDKDGTGDNDKILARRNPKHAGPDDLLPSLPLTASTDENTAQSFGEENLTQQIAQNFGTAYLTRKFASASNSNGTETPNLEGLETLVFADMQDAIAKTAQIELPDKFSAADIQTNTDSSSSAIRTYINAVGNAISQAPNTPEKSEVEILEQVLTNEDLKPLKEIKLHSENYKYFSEKIKDISVPETLADTQLALINTFWRLYLITQVMANMDTDPLKSLASISQYDQEIKKSLEPLGSIVDEIKKRNIVYSDEEGGIIFSKYATVQ